MVHLKVPRISEQDLHSNGMQHGGRTASAIGRNRVAAGRVLLLAFLGGQFVPCSGQVYKWVDEKGVTHYSEQPPPGGKAQAIGTPSKDNVKGKPNPSSESKTWQQQEIEFRQRQIESEEKRRQQEARENESRREAAMRRESCMDARRTLQSLQEQRPVYWIDERGERRYVEDKERPEIMRRARLNIERDCPAR